MPYIHPKMRPKIRYGTTKPRTAGELNFKLTDVLLTYWKTHEHNYQTINDMVGALEGAKQELYRRLVAPFEDTKIQANGDVYTECQ